jgi:hypothetical protein
MSLLRSTIAALVLFSSTAFAADAPPVGDALTQWKAAVETGSVDKVMAMYDKEAIMFSVFAIKPLETPKELRGYYKKVVENPDISVKITESHPRQYGDIAINSGLYTLSYTQDGETVSIPSRFTFAYILKGGKWMIVDHHSSKVPLAESVQ